MRPIDIVVVVDEQGAPFPAREVLRFVEAECGEPAERSEWSTAIRPEQTMSVVFDEFGAQPAIEDGVDTVEVACNAGIVDRNDRADRFVHELVEMTRIESERAIFDVAEEDARSLARVSER